MGLSFVPLTVIMVDPPYYLLSLFQDIIMARVTVEDCLEQGYTNYELVLKTAKRARDIAEGAQPLVEEDGDKPIVIALREIADDVKPEDVIGADMDIDAPDEMTMDQDQSQKPVEISIS